MSANSGFLDQEIVKRFYERVAESLERKPIDLQPGAHRERLKALLGGLGELTFYDLLAVEPSASEEEIHKAYLELGRLVHSTHAKPLGMPQGKAGLDLLFERATQAYLTLNDPDRRSAYQMATGMRQSGVMQQSSEERRKEQVEQADRFYGVARGLAVEANYHDAVQTLEQAVKLDPQPEYFALLGECLAYNPNWLDRAQDAYTQAIERSPHDPNLHARLAHVYERRDNPKEARDSYTAALTLDPDHGDSLTGLERLRVAKVEVKKAEAVGLVERIKGFFKR